MRIAARGAQISDPLDCVRGEHLRPSAIVRLNCLSDLASAPTETYNPYQRIELFIDAGINYLLGGGGETPRGLNGFLICI